MRTSSTRFRSSSCCFEASTSSSCIRCCSKFFARSLSRANESAKPRSRSAAASAAVAAADSESDSTGNYEKCSYFPSPIARFWWSSAECARCSPPGPAIKTRSHAYRHFELHAHLDQLIGELLVRAFQGLDGGSYAITRFVRSAPYEAMTPAGFAPGEVARFPR